MGHPLNAIRAFSLFLLVLYGCDLGDSLKSEAELDSSVNGTTIAYAPSQSFLLELDLNADAGYSWFCAISDTTVIRLESTSYRPKNGDWNICGGLTVETFHFRTLTDGLCSITLVQRQGWLPDVPPIAAVQFTVLVHR
jgi:predicted secreted protein